MFRRIKGSQRYGYLAGSDHRVIQLAAQGRSELNIRRPVNTAHHRRAMRHVIQGFAVLARGVGASGFAAQSFSFFSLLGSQLQ